MATVVFVAGDDVSTDAIYPGRYMATVLPTETPQFAFADSVEFNTRLKAKQIPPGSILVAGKNFGCGSSREQAVSALKGYDLTVIAESFARIFMQNSINLGLKLVVAPGVRASEGDRFDVFPDRVVNNTTGAACATVRLPEARQAIIDAGGLIPYTRTLLQQRRRGG
jgi:3-isopropylmalate/(R)-2-methylmalate dehydratase small subunit